MSTYGAVKMIKQESIDRYSMLGRPLLYQLSYRTSVVYVVSAWIRSAPLVDLRRQVTGDSGIMMGDDSSKSMNVPLPSFERWHFPGSSLRIPSISAIDKGLRRNGAPYMVIAPLYQ